MKCAKCSSRAVYLFPTLCRLHFIENIEKKVISTIEKYSLINNGDKIVVAASGGKDSLCCLYILNKYFSNVRALIIDEGIRNYRDITRRELALFCRKNKIPLSVVTFKKEAGSTLDEVLSRSKENPCTVCGVMRRYLLNKYSKGYDVIATGHNLDDEAQAIMMNIFRNNIPLLARQGIKTKGRHKKFTQRVKPLYFISEKEIKTYSLLLGLKDTFAECPYVRDSYRAKIRDFLNAVEQKKPGTKQNIIKGFLSFSAKQDGQAKSCSICHEPSAGRVCNACKALDKIFKEAKH